MIWEGEGQFGGLSGRCETAEKRNRTLKCLNTNSLSVRGIPVPPEFWHVQCLVLSRIDDSRPRGTEPVMHFAAGGSILNNDFF